MALALSHVVLALYMYIGSMILALFNVTLTLTLT